MIQSHPKSSNSSKSKRHILSKSIALKPLPFGLFLISAGLATPVMAVDVANKPINRNNIADLGETVVTGHVDELKTLYSEDLLSQPSTSLGSLLNSSMGINADTFGAIATRPILRGQRGERVTVLTDGSPQVDAASMSPDHAITTDTATATQLNIIRGSSALEYGANAATGVVNIEDNSILLNKPDQPMSGKVGTKASSVDSGISFFGDLQLMLTDSVAVTVAGSKQNRENYDIPIHLETGEHHEESEHEHAEMHENMTTDHDDHHKDEDAHSVELLQDGHTLVGTFGDEDFVRAGVSYIGERFSVGVSHARFTKEYGLPGHAHISCEVEDGDSLNCGGHNHSHGHDGDHGYEQEVHVHGTPPYIKLNSNNTAIKARQKLAAGAVKTINFSANHTDYKHEEYDQDIVTTTFTNKGYTSSLSLEHAALMSNHLTGKIGVSHADTDFAAVGAESYVPKTNTKLTAIYANEQFQIHNAWHLNLGARFEAQTLETEDWKVDHSGLSAAGESVWQLSSLDGATVSLGASYTERLPNATESFSDGIHLATNAIERGNVALKPEQTTGLELGVKKQVGGFQYDASIYHNWVADYIYTATKAYVDGISLLDYSQKDASIYGADASVSYRLNPYFTMVGFGDIVRGAFDEAAAGGSKNLPRMPAPRLGVKAITYMDNGISLETSAYHRFKQTEFADFETETPSHNMVDATLRYDNLGSSDFSLYLSGTNLLNSAAYNHASYLVEKVLLPGRSIHAGAELRF